MRFNKGDDEMVSIALSELEQNVTLSNKQRKDKLEMLLQQMENTDLKKGRIRPKDPTEAKLLDMFKRKN